MEYDARSETRLSIETSPVARTERGASRLKKSKFALMMLTAKRSSLPPRSLSLSSPPPPLFRSEEEGQSQCFGIHFSPEDPLVVVDVGYGEGEQRGGY